MTYAEEMRELLRPLGVYDLNGALNGGELDAVGAALDKAGETLDEILRETDLTAAESWGLDKMASLFSRKPIAETREDMASALAALLRIGGDSFTLAAMNDTLAGCGVAAKVAEQGVGRVTVSFPGTPGLPANFAGMQKIIEDILPPHLEIEYRLWYLLWRELEGMKLSWAAIEERGLNWGQLEVLVT
jgi:hypothetical protein